MNIRTWDELDQFLSKYLADNPDVADSVLELLFNPPSPEIAEIINRVWDENPLF